MFQNATKEAMLFNQSHDIRIEDVTPNIKEITISDADGVRRQASILTDEHATRKGIQNFLTVTAYHWYHNERQFDGSLLLKHRIFTQLLREHMNALETGITYETLYHAFQRGTLKIFLNPKLLMDYTCFRDKDMLKDFREQLSQVDATKYPKDTTLEDWWIDTTPNIYRVVIDAEMFYVFIEDATFE